MSTQKKATVVLLCTEWYLRLPTPHDQIHSLHRVIVDGAGQKYSDAQEISMRKTRLEAKMTTLQNHVTAGERRHFPVIECL